MLLFHLHRGELIIAIISATRPAGGGGVVGSRAAVGSRPGWERGTFPPGPLIPAVTVGCPLISTALPETIQCSEQTYLSIWLY